MIPGVVGLRLEEARSALEAEGVEIESLETAQPPKGIGHPPPQGAPADIYVATQWKTESGAVRLRVVSVPVIGETCDHPPLPATDIK